LQQPPGGHVAQALQSRGDALTEPVEDRVHEATHVLQHHGARIDLLDEVEGAREEVALVVGAELLTRLGERRAWNTTGEQIDLPGVGGAGPLREVHL